MAEKQKKHSLWVRLRKVILLAILAVSISIFASVFFIALVQVSGNSMQPNLNNKDVVAILKSKELKCGDIISFHRESKLLIKRVVGLPGDVISIDKKEKLYVNGVAIDELLRTENPYKGKGDITYPYTVPDGQYFVIGDNTDICIDSRVSAVGCISADQIDGKALACVWPLDRLAILD